MEEIGFCFFGFLLRMCEYFLRCENMLTYYFDGWIALLVLQPCDVRVVVLNKCIFLNFNQNIVETKDKGKNALKTRSKFLCFKMKWIQQYRSQLQRKTKL